MVTNVELDNLNQVGWYCTPYQVRNKIRANPNYQEVEFAFQDLDDDQIHDLILESQSIIDGALISIYPSIFPVAFVDNPALVPPLVNTIAVNLAASLTLAAIYGGNSPTPNPFEKVFYDRAMDLLMKLQEGILSIVSSSGSLVEPDYDTADYGGTSNTENETNVMPLMNEDYNDIDINWNSGA